MLVFITTPEAKRTVLKISPTISTQVLQYQLRWSNTAHPFNFGQATQINPSNPQKTTNITTLKYPSMIDPAVPTFGPYKSIILSNFLRFSLTV